MGDRKESRIHRKWIGGLLALLLTGLSYAGTHHYYYTDPQGTVLAKADASGNIIATYDYAPYGMQAMGAAPNGPGYTGHVNDPETGLVYMQARYYDPGSGRFLSTDPVALKPGDILALNRFSYANSNPNKYKDPDGREIKISGTNDDLKQFIAIAHQATGLNLTVKNGKVVQSGQRDGAVGSALAAKILSGAISMKQSMSIAVKSNDPKTLIDRQDTKVLDVADVGALFKRNSDLGTAAFTHVISERALMAKGATFDSAHNTAVGIESQTYGHGATTREDHSTPYPGGVFEVDYLDSKNQDVGDFKFTLDQNVTPVP